ncbi:STAS domain-containing protein [Brevibacterium rongguiense]|uniref:STAS domain-containing protein n=1 Tax=Brevibacterium rongguiense TaxID=2695267 RepID=UPI0038B40125
MALPRGHSRQVRGVRRDPGRVARTGGHRHVLPAPRRVRQLGARCPGLRADEQGHGHAHDGHPRAHDQCDRPALPHADGSKLVALQGVLDFPTAEMALRRFAQIPPGSDDVIIDLTLVPSIAQAGAKMLLTGMRSLTAEGHGIVIVDPHQRLTAGEDQVTGLRRLDSRPRGALTAAEAPTG